MGLYESQQLLSNNKKPQTEDVKISDLTSKSLAASQTLAMDKKSFVLM